MPGPHCPCFTSPASGADWEIPSWTGLRLIAATLKRGHLDSWLDNHMNIKCFKQLLRSISHTFQPMTHFSWDYITKFFRCNMRLACILKRNWMFCELRLILTHSSGLAVQTLLQSAVRPGHEAPALAASWHWSTCNGSRLWLSVRARLSVHCARSSACPATLTSFQCLPKTD